MRKINRSMSAAVLAVAVAGGAYAFLGSPMTPVAQAHLKDHPKLEAAYNALKDADAYIKGSSAVFKGNKEEALHAIHVAQTKISLCVDDAEKKSSLGGNRPIGLAEEHHPKIHEAIKRLKEAHEYLHDYKDDFHGHRDEAIKAVDEAMHALEKMIAE